MSQVTDSFLREAREALRDASREAEQRLAHRNGAYSAVEAAGGPEAEQAYSRLQDDRASARVTVQCVNEAEWWEQASPADIGEVWRTLGEWRDGDAVAFLNVGRMRHELAARYEIDVDEHLPAEMAEAFRGWADKYDELPSAVTAVGTRGLEASGELTDPGLLALASGALSDARVTISVGLDDDAREHLQTAISDLDQARDPLAAHARQYVAALDDDMTPQKRTDVVEAIGDTIAVIETRTQSGGKEPSESYAQGVSDAYNANAANARRAASSQTQGQVPEREAAHAPVGRADVALDEVHRVAAANFPAGSRPAGQVGVEPRPRPPATGRAPSPDFSR